MNVVKETELSNAEAAKMLQQFLEEAESGSTRLPPTTHQQLLTLRTALKKSAKGMKHDDD